eukprot:g4009.t1
MLKKKKGGGGGGGGAKRKKKQRKPKEYEGVYFRCTTHSVVGDVLRSRPGWTEVDPESDDYDFNWSDVHWVHENVKNGSHALVNHFPNHYELTRKDLLIKNVKRMRKSLRKSVHRDAFERFFLNAADVTRTL